MATVERSERFDVTPGELWPVLTDPIALGEWLGAAVEFDARPGGRLHVLDGDGGERIGTVRRVVPAEQLEFTWTALDGEARPSAVRFELVPDGDGTILHVTETRLGVDRVDGSEQRALARA